MCHPLELIDKALDIASRPEVIFCSLEYAPGTWLQPGFVFCPCKRRAGKSGILPLDAVRLARQNPDKQIVFFAIGFETTAPANAASVLQAEALGLTNYSILVSHVRVPLPCMPFLVRPNPGSRVFWQPVTSAQ
jgi:hydrogenase expression/formation protein HypD